MAEASSKAVLIVDDVTCVRQLGTDAFEELCAGGTGTDSCYGDSGGPLTIDTAEGAGVLHQLLKPLADHDVSMTRIESRPSRRKNWDYVFFIDLEGHAEEHPAVDALAELKESSSLFRVLGAYPKAVS